MKNTRLIIILSIVVIMLLIPFISMQFTDKVNWNAFDFLVMGFLLTGTGFLIELVLRTIKTTTNRIIFCVGILLLFFLIWAELAVGIFGTPFAGS